MRTLPLSRRRQPTHCVHWFIPRVHELVAGSSAWRVCTARSKAKIDNFVLSAALTIPRVRTYHTKEPSRFVHALSARPLKVQGGRGSDTCADGSRNFCQPSPAGEGVARSVTDEVLPCAYCKKTYLAMFAHRRAPKSEPRGSP